MSDKSPANSDDVYMSILRVEELILSAKEELLSARDKLARSSDPKWVNIILIKTRCNEALDEIKKTKSKWIDNQEVVHG